MNENLDEQSKLPQAVGQRTEMMGNEPFVLCSMFAETVEYRRFAQVCEASRRYRYISVCLGASGWERRTRRGGMRSGMCSSRC